MGQEQTTQSSCLSCTTKQRHSIRLPPGSERSLFAKQRSTSNAEEVDSEPIEFEVESDESNQWFKFCQQSLYQLSCEHPTDTFGKLYELLTSKCQDFKICSRF